MNQAANTAHNY
uniref:Uncharacterized protein n=1 Tax=Arundo donax TaxID=35708 RepID=A0A0A9FKK0_ARUDO